MSVNVHVGVNRNELLAPAYEFTRLASAYRFAGFSPAGRLITRAGLPDFVWQEPTTGVLMLRPNCWHSGFAESPYHKIGRLGLDELYLAENPGSRPAFLAVKTDTGRKVLAREHNTSIVWLLATLTEQEILDKLAGLGEPMKVAWRTKAPLQMNEGFGAIITPTGVSDDRADHYYAFIFGDRFCINILMSGAAEVYERVALDPSEPESREWVFRERYNFSTAGVDHMQPFMVCVIPWGPAYISLTFTQTAAAPTGGLFAVTAGGTKSAAFLIDLRTWGYDPRWHSGQHQFEKVKPAHLTVAMRENVHMYDDAPFRIRYTSTGDDPFGTLFFAPEYLPNVYPGQTPFVQVYGYEGQREAGSGPSDGAFVRPSIVNSGGGEWVDTDDKVLLVKMQLGPSVGKLYTPEVWWHEGGVDRLVHVPTHSIATPPFRYIRMQKTCGLHASECNVKLHDDAYYPQLLRRGLPITVNVAPAIGGDPIPVFDGYVDLVQPNVVGATNMKDPRLPPDPLENPLSARLRVTSEMQGYDMWDRLESTPVRDTITYVGKPLGRTLVKLLRMAGFDDSEIELTDESELNAIIIDKENEAGTLDSFHEDAMIGDAIRDLLSHLAIQGESFIRVRWVGNKWKVYFAPAYMYDETPILKVFHLDASLVPLLDETEGIGRTDTQRWFPPEEGGIEHYYIKSEGNLEVTVSQPEFNAVKCVAAASRGSAGNEKLEFYVPPAPAVLNDENSPIYEGRIRAAVIGPPEITAQNMSKLQQQGRMIYDATQRGNVQATFPGEWQPPVTIDGRSYGLDVDDFIAIVGRNLDGEPVSYGVWRIEAMDIEIREDHAIPALDGSATSEWTFWDRHADYTVVYVGPTALSTFPLEFPMFSTRLPLFGGWPPV